MPRLSLHMTAHDRAILRGLGQRLAEFATEPAMADRIARGKALNALKGNVRPIVLLWPGGNLLDAHWQVIRRIPNLRRVSVSPWSDQAKMAEYLGAKYVFSRKPNPALLASRWDEELIRKDLATTLTLTRGLNVEFIMKDVITVPGEEWRYRRWVEIAREEIARVYGG